MAALAARWEANLRWRDGGAVGLFSPTALRISRLYTAFFGDLREFPAWPRNCTQLTGNDKVAGPNSRVWGKAELNYAVRQYLVDHPQAMDTLEGIAEWWLTRQDARVELETLARVLRDLTAEGVLEQMGSGDQARFRLRKVN